MLDAAESVIHLRRAQRTFHPQVDRYEYLAIEELITRIKVRELRMNLYEVVNESDAYGNSHLRISLRNGFKVSAVNYLPGRFWEVEVYPPSGESYVHGESFSDAALTLFMEELSNA